MGALSRITPASQKGASRGEYSLSRGLGVSPKKMLIKTNDMVVSSFNFWLVGLGALYQLGHLPTTGPLGPPGVSAPAV